MTDDERTLVVRDNGDLHKYRTEIPNMIDDSGLNVYEFRLYVHLKRVAGTEGKCWQGTRTLAEKCGMSLASVSAAKASLAEKGLIVIAKGNAAKSESDTITIVDIWPENFAMYGSPRPCSPHEHPVRTANTPVPATNTPVRHTNERSNPIKKEPIKEEPKGEDAPSASPLFEEFIEELCSVCYGHKETTSLTAKELGALRGEGKKILSAGFDVADLRTWMTGHWFKDWRWKKDQQRPTPAMVRSSIAKVRAAPEDATPRTQYSQYNTYREAIS